MPKEKGKCPCSESQTGARTPVGGRMEISPEAYQLLRNATIPFEFKEAVRVMIPDRDLLLPPAGMEDVPPIPGMDIPTMEIPVPQVSFPPVEMPVASPLATWSETATPALGIDTSFRTNSTLERPGVLRPTRLDVPSEPLVARRVGGAVTFYLTDLKLDLSDADMTPGLVAFVGTPLGWIIGNLFFWQDPRVAAAAYLGPCAAKVQLVQPVLLKARVALALLPEGEELDVPDRDKAIKAAEDALKEAAARVRGDGAATDEIPSNLGNQKTTQERAWREKHDRASKEDLDLPAQPRPKGDTEYETIRSAGQTVITHRICTFWSYEPYRFGQETVDCCVLRNIWVQPRAQVRINPRRKLYIKKKDGTKRINEEQYDGLTQNGKNLYDLAEPYSIEAHERAHVADYVSFLEEELAELRFRAFVTTKAEWEANDRRVRDHVQHICDSTYGRYTLRELKVYPHGKSEKVAGDSQREAIKVGEDKARKVIETLDREAQEEVERCVKGETARGRRRCVHQPEATPHCLRAD